MGTIGVGYLLNGTTGYETVNDYDYVTDVSGLYTYTPVTAYAAYSPAQNNYQYNTDSSLLGTYTDGITYTAAASANLNPIITPSSGVVTVQNSIAVSGFSNITDVISSAVHDEVIVYTGKNSNNGGSGRDVSAKAILLSDIASAYPSMFSATLTIPASQTVNFSTGSTVIAQKVGIYCGGSAASYTADSTCSSRAVATDASTSLAYKSGVSDTYIWTTGSEHSSWVGPGSMTYEVTNYVGVVSDITVNPNGTATYNYTYNGSTTTITKNQSEIVVVCWDETAVDSMTLTYTTTEYNDIDYLDPNYGVAISDSETPVYWSNSNSIGAATWAFQKPSAASSVTVQAYNGSTALSSFTVDYDTTWTLTYTGTGGQVTVDLGSDWAAVYVRMYYTGELQVGALDGFFNFTTYTMKLPTTYTTSYSGNVPITMCKLSGSTTMRFACIETTVASGTVPGAMYDASFDVSNFFPSYTNVRISFDSAAYVGTSVTTGTWTMAVDSSTFVGTFTVDSTTYYADLTQPWALIWDPAGHVDITFTGVNELGTQKVTVLDTLNTPAVALGGQWVLDTDLYTVSTHVEEVYDWNFGEWGLDKTQFLVCAMGLTALISILMKLGGVPFRLLDFIVILVGNVIFWVVM